MPGERYASGCETLSFGRSVWDLIGFVKWTDDSEGKLNARDHMISRAVASDRPWLAPCTSSGIHRGMLSSSSVSASPRASGVVVPEVRRRERCANGQVSD